MFQFTVYLKGLSQNEMFWGSRANLSSSKVRNVHMGVIMKKYPLVIMSFLLIGWTANSQPVDTAAAAAAATAAQQNPPVPREGSEMAVRDRDPVGNCSGTKTRAVNECMTPTGSGFEQAGQLLTTLPAIATAFMGGEDPGKMAEMCQLTQIMGAVSGLLNGGQNTTCQNASSICQEVCGESRDQLRQLAAAQPTQIDVIRLQLEQVNEDEEDCVAKATEQMQLAQQQQQANQQPMAGAEACQNALNSDDEFEEELVDCSLAQYANSAQCTTLGKTDGNGIPFEPGQTISQDDSATDFPGVEDREDFWNDLKNKTSGNAGGRGAGAGGAGPMGGGPGGGSGANNRAGGAARKSGSTMLSGGNESSGGGGSGFNLGGDDDFNKKFAKLDAKKKKLNMLTKKKIGGRGIASSEFGLASDDIWTRVYLRTNTRCTKQLTECTANKSLNPYGVSNKAR